MWGDNLLDNLKLYVDLRRRSTGDVSLGDLLWYFSPWSASLKNGRNTVADECIWIVFKAKTFLDRLMRPGIRVFEYGAGGSTLYFLKHGCELISVEHHPEWFAKVQKEVQRREYLGWKGFLREPDARDLGGAVARVPGSYESQFPGYTANTFQAYATTIEDFPDRSFDLVLVDGRARVSCVHHAASKVKRNGWLVLIIRSATDTVPPSRCSNPKRGVCDSSSDRALT
jgi:hypothetical protein